MELRYKRMQQNSMRKQNEEKQEIDYITERAKQKSKIEKQLQKRL